MGYRGDWTKWLLVGTLSDTIFQKKGLQVWDIGGLDKVVTCWDTF